MAKGKTIATLVRNELGLLSLKGKKTWSETGRGGMIAQSSVALLGRHKEYFEVLGFKLERESDVLETWVWGDTQVRMYVSNYGVEISYLLAMRDWHEEQGIPC
jgi:hypothetical protein